MFLATSLRSFFLFVAGAGAGRRAHSLLSYENLSVDSSILISQASHKQYSLPALAPALAYTGVHILTQTQTHAHINRHGHKDAR